MSKLLINEPPLQVLPSLALAIGLNEAIVLQQLHYLLLDPNHGRKIAEHRWIFNTIEQWVVGYFPFWSGRSMRRIFASLSRQNLILTCQPEGRLSRRQYYRINTVRLDAISDAANLAPSMRPKTALPITKTTVQKKVKGTSSEAPSGFSRHPYPKSEEEMIETLELHDVEHIPDYDGNFFETMTRNDWKIRGERVFDWIETYRARLMVTYPGGNGPDR